MITAVIFDIDGTLVDTVDLQAEAWQETFREFGKGVPLDKIREQIGKGADQMLPVFWTEEELAQAEEQISERQPRLFHQKYLARVKAFPQTRELVQRILQDGKKVALASFAAGEELQTYKERADISDLIEAESSADDAAKSKPPPDIFQDALEQLGHPAPAETIVVGDTPYDVEVAGRLALRVIALRCGGFPEETLRGAFAIYNDPADLLAHYDESGLGCNV